MDRSGHVVVVDSKQSAIFVFQPGGKLVQKFGSRGSDVAKLAGPQFVAINSLDQIIVSDFHNHAVKVMTLLIKMDASRKLKSWTVQMLFLKNGPNQASFCLFLFFSHGKYSKNTLNVKSINGVLGTRTRGGRMVGADECTEL